jgi:predicted RNA binding protein YcfA (HicA-like mRNA interferase family)
MSKIQKLIQIIMMAQSDHNIEFKDLIKILSVFGFEYRIKGSHHIFFRSDVAEIINIQPNGSKAKAYQVKQIRDLIIKYKLYATQ